MKSLLKFVLLLALIVGGRLTRTNHQVAVTPQSKAPATAEVVLVHQRQADEPAAPRAAEPEPNRAQVLSVFFK